jgi:hypothetical protein
MDVDTTSVSSSAADQHENEMDSHLAERFGVDAETLSTEVTAKSEEIFYSTGYRWSKRAAYFEALKARIRHWRRQSRQEMADLENLLLPSTLGFKWETLRTKECVRCTLCKAIAELKQACQSFLDSKQVHLQHVQEYTVTMEEYDALLEERIVVAENQVALQGNSALYALAENQVALQGNSAETAIILQMMAKLRIQDAELQSNAAEKVADKAKLVSKAAGTVDDKAELVSKAAKLVSKAAVIVADKAELINLAHSEVKSLLGALRLAGNETKVTSSKEPSSQNVNSGGTTNMTKIGPPAKASPSKFDKLCNLSAIETCEPDFLETLSDKQTKLIRGFYRALRPALEKATVLTGNETVTDYCDKINETVKGIIGWIPGKTMKTSSGTFYMPGCESQEKNGVQPILYAIMVKIGQLLGLGQQITQEQWVQRVDNRRGSYIDFVVTSLEEYLVTILPGMMGIPIEVKPISRKKTKVAKLLLEAQNQVIGHLAKRAMYSFDFGGFGENCKVFGLELTMGSVAVIVLELSGVGTADVKVTTQRTKRMPLFDEAIRTHIFGNMASDVESSLEKEEQEGMPAGFSLLARTLNSTQPRLGISLKTGNGYDDHIFMRLEDGESIKVDQYLGSGAFSHALKLDVQGRNDVFMKVSKSFHTTYSLENEAKALKELSGHTCIPKLYDIENKLVRTVNINIMCESSALSCLLLTGLIDLPASERKCWGSEKLERIFIAVYSALKYANEKQWAHLDVRPSNIITSFDFNHPNGDIKVMLIDWGCASRTTTNVRRFVGCTPYAHDQLFDLRTTSCKPCLDHDLASLAYSLASLFEGRMPWAGFADHRNVSVDVKHERFKEASRILIPLLETWEVASDYDKETLLTAIGHERKVTGNELLRRSKRKRRSL